MIKNLTPHSITVAGRVFPASGVIPRVSTSTVDDGAVEGLPVVRTVLGAVEGLPEPRWFCPVCGAEAVGFGSCRDYCGHGEFEGVTLIVSALVLSALGGTRPDCVAPDTSPGSAIRNDAGQIIGVRRFTR